MTLRDIGTALMAAVPNCSHLEAREKTDRYLVWAEDGQGETLHGDDRMLQQAVTGTVDYFTRTEYDPAVQKIQAALNGLGIPWRLVSIQYEDGTEYQHYEWAWELPLGVG